MGCYLLLVLVLPQPPLIGTCSRYMFPVAAVFVPFAFLGAGRVFRPLSRFRAARPAAAVLLALLALQELRATREIVAACNATDTVVELREFARAIGTRLPTNAVIATDYNLPIVDLWTASGRRFAMDPSSCCMGPSDAAIGSPAISHRVVAGPPWPPGAPVLRSSSDHWRIYPATRNALGE